MCTLSLESIAIEASNPAPNCESIWEETHESIQIVNGSLSVDLGIYSTLPTTINPDDQVFLGIQLNDELEMQPRMNLKAQANMLCHTQERQELNVINSKLVFK